MLHCSCQVQQVNLGANFPSFGTSKSILNLDFVDDKTMVFFFVFWFNVIKVLELI
jgi:hypothetical protein